MKKFSKIGYCLVIAFLVIITGLLFFSMLPITGNFEIKTVLSGSMEPAIKVGSVVVIKPVDVYEIGDVITFGKDTKADIPTTHRIESVRVESGKYVFVTRGDANEDRDAKEVVERDIVGKVFLDIPYLGFILDMARKPIGFVVLIGIPALIIISDEFTKIYKEVKKLRKKKEVEIKNEEV